MFLDLILELGYCILKIAPPDKASCPLTRHIFFVLFYSNQGTPFCIYSVYGFTIGVDFGTQNALPGKSGREDTTIIPGFALCRVLKQHT